MGLNQPFATVPDSFDARWVAWQTNGIAQGARWRSYAIAVAILLGGSLAVAFVGVISAGFVYAG